MERNIDPRMNERLPELDRRGNGIEFLAHRLADDKESGTSYFDWSDKFHRHYYEKRRSEDPMRPGMTFSMAALESMYLGAVVKNLESEIGRAWSAYDSARNRIGSLIGTDGEGVARLVEFENRNRAGLLVLGDGSGDRDTALLVCARMLSLGRIKDAFGVATSNAMTGNEVDAAAAMAWDELPATMIRVTDEPHHYVEAYIMGQIGAAGQVPNLAGWLEKAVTLSKREFTHSLEVVFTVFSGELINFGNKSILRRYVDGDSAKN